MFVRKKPNKSGTVSVQVVQKTKTRKHAGGLVISSGDGRPCGKPCGKACGKACRNERFQNKRVDYLRISILLFIFAPGIRNSNRVVTFNEEYLGKLYTDGERGK